jgi:hypothetical protein
MIEYIMGTLWAHFERTLNEWPRFVVGSLRTSCERTLGALSKGCLLGILTGSFRTNPKFTHGAHHDQNGGYVLKELSICPLGIKWVNCLKTLNKLTMCLPGKTPSAPSVIAAILFQPFRPTPHILFTLLSTFLSRRHMRITIQ